VRIQVLLFVLPFALFACRSREAESTPDKDWRQVPVQIELRIAEKLPAPGLTTGLVYGESDTVYLHSRVEISNAQIARAETVEKEEGLVLQFWFTGEGLKRLATMSAENIGNSLAILINSEVFSAPAIVQAVDPSPDIPGQVRVRLAREQAQQLARAVAHTWPPAAAR
jgi:preprotein translocase subunit SecD